MTKGYFVLHSEKGDDLICARFTVFTEEEIIEMRAIIAEVSRKFGDGAVGAGDIRPTNMAPILMMDGNRLAPYPVSWGFPKWNGKGVDINARTDTVLYALDHPEKRSIWRKPILTRRCVIPSTGFYEWTATAVPEQQITLFPVERKPSAKAPKVKLLFRRPGEPMLYMAGMIDTFLDKDGNAKDAFVILTTAANDSMERFHDRMPLIISPNEREDWIKSDAFMREILMREGPELEWKIAG